VSQDGRQGMALPATEFGDFVRLSSNRVSLRPIRPADYGFLYELSMNPEIAWSWKYRTGQVGFEQFIQELREGVLHQFIVDHVDVARSGEQAPIGQVICYNADYRNKHAFLAAQGDPKFHRVGAMIDATQLLITYVFGLHDFHTLYIECSQFVLEAYYPSIDRFFSQEAHLIDHEYYFGRFWDTFIFSITRKSWSDLANAHGLVRST
jgi:RimJ/RimL family protein N-acetyltransferase